jgi:hypothetical protein
VARRPDLGDEDEQPVAPGVAQAVIDLLEPVEIDQHDRGRELVTGGPGNLGLQPLLDRPAVVQAGEAVRRRRAVKLFDQERILERDRRGEGQGAGQLEFRDPVVLARDPRAERQHREPLGTGFEGDQNLAPGIDLGGERHVVGADHAGTDREGVVQLSPVERGGLAVVVQRAECLGDVFVVFRPIEAGPPGKEDFGNEVHDQLFGFVGGMDRREEPGDLAEGAELEGRIVEGRLPLEQHCPQLEDDGESQCERGSHPPHFAGDPGLGPDDDLSLAALDSGDLYGPGPPLRRADIADNAPLAGDDEPDLIAMKAADQGLPAPLE